MFLIAHRANLNGPSTLENSPKQVDVCLDLMIDCEVDLWVNNGKFLLGHDFGQHEVDLEWLTSRQDSLWVHCKNSEALDVLTNSPKHSLNFFWHQSDDYTVTSKGFVWVYPGQKVPPNGVGVLPEHWLTKDRIHEVFSGFAICTDFVLKYRTELEEHSP